MPIHREFERVDRLSQLLHREIASMLQSEVKDPRMAFVTVSDVQVTRDLAYAKIYITSIKEVDSVKKTIATLNQAAGFFRTQLSKRLKLRKIPELQFIYDKTLVEATRLSKIINDAVAHHTPAVESTQDNELNTNSSHKHE